MAPCQSAQGAPRGAPCSATRGWPLGPAPAPLAAWAQARAPVACHLSHARQRSVAPFGPRSPPRPQFPVYSRWDSRLRPQTYPSSTWLHRQPRGALHPTRSPSPSTHQPCPPPANARCECGGCSRGGRRPRAGARWQWHTARLAAPTTVPTRTTRTRWCTAGACRLRGSSHSFLSPGAAGLWVLPCNLGWRGGPTCRPCSRSVRGRRVARERGPCGAMRPCSHPTPNPRSTRALAVALDCVMERVDRGAGGRGSRPTGGGKAKRSGSG